MKLDKDQFSRTVGGKETSLQLLRMNNGIEVAVTNYGARIVAIVLPAKDGSPTDVVTGFDSLNGYLQSSEQYHGAIVGRYANRIARGRFSLKGEDYQLAINNPPNHLHGGPSGFHKRVWTIEKSTPNCTELSYLSEDGEENYPGNLKVNLTYTVSENALSIHYEAITDEATIFNITSHPFFNLNGQGTGPITGHLLSIHADRFTPVDESLIPTGIRKVDHTPFDFRKPRTIGEKIDEDDDQLRYGGGYDHNFVLNGNGLRSVAKATGDQSGISMEVITDQPGMQLYSGNYMAGENKIKYGLTDTRRSAFCLETQHYPDSPNHPGFPSTVLEPGQAFRSTTVYRFSLEA